MTRSFKALPAQVAVFGLAACAVLLSACAGKPDGSTDSTAGTGERASLDSGTVPGIEIEYVAHAAFRLRSGDGTELLIDPFASRIWLGYDWPPGIEPDAILITHPHYDHDAGRYRELPFPWDPEVPVMDSPGSRSFGAFTVTGVHGKHADPYGMEFGQRNTPMVIEAHGLRIAHLGDNGPLSAETVAGLGRVDVLLLPADAVYHILSEEVTQEIIRALDPRVVIPMHYRLPDLEVDADSPSDLGDIGPWLEGREGVERVGGHVATLTAGALPVERIYLVFEHAPYVGGM